MIPKDQAKVLQVASAKQSFKEFEQGVALPLASNSYFRSFRQSFIDLPNKINYLNFGVHKILRDLYDHSANSRPDQLLILEAILDLSDATKYIHDFAILGSFMQEAFLCIRDNICLYQHEPLQDGFRDYKGNYKVQKQAQKPFYDDVFKLEPIIEENILVVKMWLQIAINFLKSPSIVEYCSQYDYLFFEYALSFLTKCDMEGFVMENKLKEEFKSLFFTLLEVCFNSNKLCELFLQNSMLTYWLLDLIDTCTTFQEFAKAYQLLGQLAKTEKLPVAIGDKDIITQYAYGPMVKVVYPDERLPWEQALLSNPDKLKDYAKTAVLLFYTLSANKSNTKALLTTLKKFHTDILLRFFVYCIVSRDHFCVVHMTFGLLNLLKSDSYKFPTFASRLGVFLVASIIGKDDLLLMLVLRIVKYITFNKNQKICIFQMLLSSDTGQSLELSLVPIDLLVFRKNLDESPHEKDKDKAGTTQHVAGDNENVPKKGKYTKVNKDILFNHTFDGVDLFDDDNKPARGKDDEDLYRALIRQQSKNVSINLLEVKSKDAEFYFQKRNYADENYARKIPYPFINDMGENYRFIRDCDGLCPYCNSAKGLFSATDDELREYCFRELKKAPCVTLEDPADLSLAIFQAVFEFTLDDSISFLYTTVVPYYCQFLLADGIPIKYKFPILLYFLHLILNYRRGAQILYGISFLLFTEDFLTNFLDIFDLASLRKWKDTKLIKVLVPKKKVLNKVPNKLPTSNGKPSPGSPPTKTGEGATGQSQDGSMLMLDMEEVEINGVSHLVWNNERNCFIYDNKVIDGQDEESIAMGREDALTDDGKYSKYFWKLHFMHHCLRVVLEMVRSHSEISKKIVETQLENFVEQIKEITIILYKYSEKFIPTLPFHEDTECWNEIKNIIYETLGILEEIQIELISKFPKFASQFFKMATQAPEILVILIKLIGRLPTLSSSIALVSCLSLAHSFETSSSQELPSDGSENTYVLFFNNLSKELHRLEGGIGAAINSKDLSRQSIKKTDRIVTNALQFLIHALNILNHISIKERIPSDKLDKKNMETFFKSFISILKLLRKFMLEEKNAPRKNHIKNYKKFDGYDDDQPEEPDLDKLYYQLFLNSSVFLWAYSAYKSTTTALLRSDIISFCFNDIWNIDLLEDMSFSFLVAFHNICQNAGDMKNIASHYPSFERDVKAFILNSNRHQKPLLVPVFRGLKILLAQNPQDRLSFRELVPFLREILNEKYGDFINGFLDSHNDPEPDDDFARMLVGKQAKMLRMASRPNFDYVDVKKQMRNYAKSKEFEQLKLLKKEAKGLMQLIGIVSVVEIEETRKKFNDHRKDVIYGAGLVSDKTVKFIYDDQQRMNRIDNREPDRRRNNMSNSRIDPYHVNPGHSMHMLPKGILYEDQLRQKKAKDSMNVDLASFNMSREMAALKYRPGPEEFYDRYGRNKNPLGSMVRHSSNGNIRNDAFFDQVPQMPQSYKQFTQGNYVYPPVQRHPSPHILRDNGKNIMKTVDNEYQNMVWNQMNSDRRHHTNIDKRYY